MQNNIETILEELYMIDSSLRDYSSDLHTLVTTLATSKPDVTIDQDFLRNLRHQLMVRSIQKNRITSQTPSPFGMWLFRLAPLGIVAILTLSLIPSSVHSPMDSSYSIPTSQIGGEESIMQYKSYDTRVQYELQTTAPSPEHGITLESTTLTQPGFAVAQTATGEVVGVSSLLPRGTTVGVRINFTRILQVNEEITVTTYTDNGDGIFTNTDLSL
jgi:hypothetical protein